MASIKSLPADQRAVLELVLRRGRSYDEIARLLSIDRAGVRQRALAALDTLGPQTRIGADRRALITDYLLDALPAAVASEVRERLGSSATERAWARAVASELQGLSEHPLPEIPANGRRRRDKGARKRVPAAAAVPAGPEIGIEALPDAEPASNGAGALPEAVALSNGTPREQPPREQPPREQPPRRRPSRLGGAVVLGLVAAVAIALVLVFVVFGGGAAHKHRALAEHPSKATASSSAAAATKILAQIPLTPPSGGTQPLGLAYIVRVQNSTGILIRADGLAPNSKSPPNHYAVWLSNPPSQNYLLGVLKQAVGSNGQLVTGGGLPSTAAKYHKVLVTLETTSALKAPGRIILEGNLKGL